jgi:chromosomal replication initiator protein
MFNDFTAHIRTSQNDYKTKSQGSNDFKNKYRNTDVLLIDDIHTLQGKKATQEELFHTFNDLYEAKKQIVFTCDRPISELKDINDRLKNRFERGLNVDLQPPNFETKVAIIQKKLDHLHSYFPAEVIELVAKTICTNVRDLESAITNIQGYAELTSKDITLHLAQERLKINIASTQVPKGSISIARVQRIVAQYFNVTINDLKGKKKNKSIVYPRQIAMYICRQITDFPTTEIGLEFGGRDHTTVMYGCQKIHDLKMSDPTIESTIQNLIRSVHEHEEMI